MGLFDLMDEVWGAPQGAPKPEPAAVGAPAPDAPTAPERSGGTAVAASDSGSVVELPVFAAPDPNGTTVESRLWPAEHHRYGLNPLRRVSPSSVPRWCLEGASWALIDTGEHGWWWVRDTIPLPGYGPDFPAGAMVSFALHSSATSAADLWRTVHLRRVMTATPRPRTLFALLALTQDGIPAYSYVSEPQHMLYKLRELGCDDALVDLSRDVEVVITRADDGDFTAEHRTDARDPRVMVERKRLMR